MNIVEFAFLITCMKYLCVISVVATLGIIFYLMRDKCGCDKEI